MVSLLGMMWVWTTSIIGSSRSISPLPPATTQGCLLTSLRVSLLSGLTSIIPRSRFWQSGGTKWGMWKTPRFTWEHFSLETKVRRLCYLLKELAEIIIIEWKGSYKEGVEDDPTGPDISSSPVIFLPLWFKDFFSKVSGFQLLLENFKIQTRKVFNTRLL